MTGSPVTLLFTDLVNSTEMLERVGDERAQQVLRAHRQLLCDALAGHAGEEVKWLGDGLLATFASVAQAVRCAVTMQQAARGRTAGERLGLRIGLDVGEVLPDERDWVGTPVVLARRLCDRAAAGQILCSRVVVELLRGRHAFQFAAVGALELKGFAEPMPACEVVYEHGDPGALRRQTPFTGRTAELARLGQRLEETRGGRGGVVLLVGEPGIGKTRALEEFAETARSAGPLVLWGRCYEGEAGRPWGPFAEALGEFVRTATDETLRGVLGPEAAPLTKLVPTLRTRVPELPEPVPLEPYEERVRLLDAVTQFLLALAARVPTVLVLDDLHWADAGTVALLRHVARFASRARLLVLGAYRDVEVDRQHALTEALGTLPRETRYDQLALGGLDAAAVRALLRLITAQEVPEAWAAALTRETSGNPFFLREVLLHLEEEGTLPREAGQWTTARTLATLHVPETVRQVIERRFARLSAGAVRLLRIAAAFTGGSPFEVARRVAGLEEGAALDVLDEALAAQLLVATADAQVYDFPHALVRHTLYEALSPVRQVRLHREIAEAMEAVYGAQAVEHAAEIARHYHRSASLPGAERGVPHCLAAADQAERAVAFAEAADHLRVALALLPETAPERPRILARLGLALAYALRFDDAVARDAAGGIAKTEGRDAAADYLAKLVTALNETGGGRVAPLVRQGLEYVAERRDLTWAVLKALDIIDHEIHDPRGPGIPLDTPERRQVARVFEHSENVPWGLRWSFVPWTSRAEIEARDAFAAHHYIVGDYRRGVPLLREDAMENERTGNIGRAVSLWAAVSRFQTALGEFDEARESRHRAVALAGRLAEPSYGTAHLIGAEDEWRMAIDDQWDTPMKAGPGVGQHRILAWYGAGFAAGIARTHARMGRVDRAMQRLASVLPAMERAPAWAENYTRIACDAAETLWLTERTDHIDVIERNLREKVIEPDFRYPMMDGRLALARLCALQRRYEEAVKWFAKARTVLDEQGARPLRAIVDYDEALMYARRGAAGDLDRAWPLVDAALVQFRSLDMSGWIRRAETLRTRCEGAGAAARVARTPFVAGNDDARMLLQRDEPGDREKAHELLDRSLRTAHDLEMPSLAEKATSLRAGETPSGPAPPGLATASDGGGSPRTGDGAPVGGSVFRKEGDYWTIAYEDVVFRLKDTKGLHYIAHLLRHPGTEFHANDLVAAASPRAGAPSHGERGPSRQEMAAEGLVVSRLGGVPALLDARAKAAYQERLSDLREELADAERLHDLGRAEQAGAEIDFLTTELTAPFRGHQKANPYAERARLTVTKGIKAALERLSQNHPALGRHLAVTIRRGTFCVYAPDPRHPIPWTF